MRLRPYATALMTALSLALQGQSVLFTFDNVPYYTPLPIDVTVGGVSVHMSYQHYGYSVQRADTMGFTPLGFAGNCIYPNTIYRDDLYADFTPPLREFSILFTPQELACGTTATMRATAYHLGVYVGTATAQAPGPGTWPVGQLVFNSPNPFDRVVVHYDAPPPTGGDFGVIFLADKMAVTPYGTNPTETLPPAQGVVNLGLVDGGELADLALRDDQFMTICKFLVPNMSSPFVRMTLDYTTTKPTPSRIEFLTTARMGNNGLFGIRLLMQDQQTGLFEEVMAKTRIGDVFQLGIGRPYYPMSRFVGQGGLVRARIEVSSTGPAATARPCVEIDEAVMKVSG